MPEVLHIGCHPLGLVEEPLCHRLVDAGEVLQDRGTEGDAIPGHRPSPPEAELVGHFFSGQSLLALERLLESGTQRFAEGEAEVGIADQLPNPVIDETLHQVFQLLGS